MNKSYIPTLAALVLLSTFTHAADPQADERMAKFESATFAQFESRDDIKTAFKKSMEPRDNPHTHLYIDKRSLPFRTEVTWKQKVRPISAARQEMVKSLNAPAEARPKQEIAVVQDGKTHWLLMQPKILETLKKEVSDSHSFVAFLRFVGQDPDGKVYYVTDFADLRGSANISE